MNNISGWGETLQVTRALKVAGQAVPEHGLEGLAYSASRQFGAALEFVGWVTFRDEGAKLNEWKKHGENTPKQRVLKARKKQPLSGKK